MRVDEKLDSFVSEVFSSLERKDRQATTGLYMRALMLDGRLIDSTLDRVRPAVVAGGLAELQICWPGVAMVFCETGQLAREWTSRFLAAAHDWVLTEYAVL